MIPCVESMFDHRHTQQAWSEDWIAKAMVLSPGEAILFFGRCSRNEGLPYPLGGQFNGARRPTQIEASWKIMQEGCHTITWPEGQGNHGERQSTPGLQLWPMMLRSGCEAWKESLMGSQNGMTIMTT